MTLWIMPTTYKASREGGCLVSLVETRLRAGPDFCLFPSCDPWMTLQLFDFPSVRVQGSHGISCCRA